MRLSLLLGLLFFHGFLVRSQEFGAIPPSVKWRQVNTSEARIIFPQGFDSTAQRVAGIIHYLNGHTGNTAGTAQRKISIVLQSQTTLSNGYVGLAPWRSEFFLTPQLNSFQLGSLPWASSLAAHEYRHVQQYMNFRKGLSKLAYIILGEEGQALANNAAVPNWFFEGDAVFQETTVSGQGRGRLPSFFNPYRSLWQADKRYRYMKLRNGSMRHYIPDHYALGYLLTGYGREKYGERFWTNVTDDAARFRGLFYPFQKAVKKYSGQTFDEFVADAFRFYEKQSVLPVTDSFVTSGNDRYVCDYLFPRFASDDTLIVMKRSYRGLPAWWLISAEGEKRIRIKDIAREDYYSYQSGKIVYTAYEPDALYSGRDYNVIKVLDLETGIVKQLTHKSKYFQPGISHDGKKLVAVQYSPDQKCQLHILDATDGSVLQRIPQPSTGTLVYTYPLFYGDDYIISCVRNAQGLMTVAMINSLTGEYDNLLPWTFEVKGFPVLKGETVFYTAGSGYQDDIFAVDIKTRRLFKLTDESLGAYQPAVNSEGRLVWSSFTAAGMQLKDRRLQAADWKPINQSATINAPDLYLPDALKQTGGNMLNDIPMQLYPVSKYKKLTAPFNFHSWRPYYEQPEWSFTLYGQNILNTFQSQLYYTYNENEGSHKAGFTGSVGVWFPWIDVGASNTFNRKVHDNGRLVRWDETNANVGIRAPFDFTKGRRYRFLTLSSSYNMMELRVTGRYKDSIAGSAFNYIQLSADWRSRNQQAVQHINPRWAHRIGLRYRNMVEGNNAFQWFGYASVSTPGIGVNHSIVLNVAFQVRDTMSVYRFSNDLPFARGYNAVDAPRMWKWGINYHFPLVYPDWGFGQLVYFLRIRGNLFFDFAQAKSLRTKEIFSFRSAGAELFFDTKWWNQQPVSFGIRYSRLLDNDIADSRRSGVWEFVLPVDLVRR